MPKYTPVSGYSGPTLDNNYAGIYVGCIQDGSSGFLVINVYFNYLYYDLPIIGGETEYQVTDLVSYNSLN